MSTSLGARLARAFKAPAARKPDVHRKARTEAKRLIEALGLELERCGAGWNLWPAPGGPDPFPGDHYASDWSELRAMARRYFAAGPFTCSAWFERDRQNLTLTGPGGVEVFSLWDDAVTDVIDSGYLKTPCHPRPGESEWLPCLVQYARDTGLIDKE